jgi:NAD(P)H dehydrogenase (quinone)
MKVLIVYYSTFGNVYKMAKLIADGVSSISGAEPIVRKVPELIPESIINSRLDMKKGAEMQKDIPVVTLEDFKNADAFAFGTPTRFGNVSAQLKNQIDQLGPLWMQKTFEGKPAGIFVSTSTPHGGQETTITTLMVVLLHLGFIIVGVPYSVPELFLTSGGGSPYGPGHIANPDNNREIDENEAKICKAFGKRLAEIGLKLMKK